MPLDSPGCVCDGDGYLSLHPPLCERQACVRLRSFLFVFFPLFSVRVPVLNSL